MKRLMMLLVAGGLMMPVYAQFSPVQVTVQRVTKKKSKQGKVEDRGSTIAFYPNDLFASLSLRITLRNSTAKPVEGVVVKWGIAKTRMSGESRGGGMAVYGAEQSCSLNPLETKVIETDAVEATGQEMQLSDRRYGEKIYGHGVQVLIGGKVMNEEFVPPGVKKGFENIRAVDSDSGKADEPRPGQKEDEKGGKGKKPKRE
jgi:hypothetical protein